MKPSIKQEDPQLRLLEGMAAVRGSLWVQSELAFSGEKNAKQELSTKYDFNPPTLMDLNFIYLKNLNPGPAVVVHPF